MKQRHIHVWGGILGMAGLTALLWSVYTSNPNNKTIISAIEVPQERVDAGAAATLPEPMVEGREAHMLEFVGDPMPSMLDVRIGGAGLDADFHARVVGNRVPIGMFYEGEELPTLEVRASSPEGCFWGDVEAGQAELSVKPGFVLNLSVRGEFGLSLKTATLRLGREVVGFVFEHPVLGANGNTAVECLPAGRYVLDVRAPGFLTSTQVIDINGHTDMNVELTRGQSATGRVKSKAGEALAGVMMVLESCSDPQTCVPHRLLVTGTDGRFHVDDLPHDAVRIRARHPDFETTTFFGIAAEPIEFMMDSASERLIKVVDPNGRAVPNVQIVWSDKGGEGESAGADRNGEWRAKGIPNGATIFASFRGHESPQVIVDSNTITLTLQPALAASLLLRVNSPADITGVEVVRVDDRARCSVLQVADRDFEVGCKEGKAKVRIQLEHGFYEETLALADGITLNVPPSQTHRLRITGSRLKSSLQVEVDYGLGFEPLICPWVSDDEARCDLRFWATSELRPRVRIRDGAARAEADLKGTETSLQLKTTSQHRVYIVDAQGSPLTGAWLGIIDAQGRRLDSATSAGQLPFERRLEEGASLQLYAVDPRRGDGALRVGTQNEQTLALSSRVGDLARPPYLTREHVEKTLGVRLVTDGAGFRFDEIAGSVAQKAGIARGAWWVAAWPDSQGIRVVSWTTKGYQEHLVKD